MKKLIFSFILLFSFICIFGQDVSEEKTKADFSVNANLTSKYFWRGVLLDDAMQFQPIAIFNYGNLNIGSFASASTTGYRELDFWVDYTIGNFTFVVTDWWIPIDSNFNFNTNLNPRFFNYNMTNIYNPHSFTTDLIYVNQKIPLVLTGSVIIAGAADQDLKGNQQYTGYIEALYSLNDYVDVFVGGVTNDTPFYMTTGAGITNVGLTINREIKLNETKIPASASIVSNPQSEALHLILSLKF